MDKEKGFGITVKAQLKHADLYAAAKKMGGQSALARHLGISVHTICTWCNLSVPRTAGDIAVNSTFADPKRRADIEQKLFDLTGKTLDELFPPALAASSGFRQMSKSSETTRRFEVRELTNRAATLRRLPAPTDNALMALDMRSAIQKILKTLSYREREIIKLRYGLGDGLTYTMEEVGYIFKVTRERVRQIEAKALRKLQQPDRATVVAQVFEDSLDV